MRRPWVATLLAGAIAEAGASKDQAPASAVA